jgi:hypothetical protein
MYSAYYDDWYARIDDVSEYKDACRVLIHDRLFISLKSINLTNIPELTYIDVW